MSMLDLQHYGYSIAGIFFGLWLVPLGYLAFKSGMFPKVLGSSLSSAASATCSTRWPHSWPPTDPDHPPGRRVARHRRRGLLLAYLLVKGVRDPRQSDAVRGSTDTDAGNRVGGRGRIPFLRRGG